MPKLAMFDTTSLLHAEIRASIAQLGMKLENLVNFIEKAVEATQKASGLNVSQLYFACDAANLSGLDPKKKWDFFISLYKVDDALTLETQCRAPMPLLMAPIELQIKEEVFKALIGIASNTTPPRRLIFLIEVALEILRISQEIANYFKADLLYKDEQKERIKEALYNACGTARKVLKVFYETDSIYYNQTKENSEILRTFENLNEFFEEVTQENYDEKFNNFCKRLFGAVETKKRKQHVIAEDHPDDKKQKIENDDLMSFEYSLSILIEVRNDLYTRVINLAEDKETRAVEKCKFLLKEAFSNIECVHTLTAQYLPQIQKEYTNKMREERDSEKRSALQGTLSRIIVKSRQLIFTETKHFWMLINTAQALLEDQDADEFKSICDQDEDLAWLTGNLDFGGCPIPFATFKPKVKSEKFNQLLQDFSPVSEDPENECMHLSQP